MRGKTRFFYLWLTIRRAGINITSLAGDCKAFKMAKIKFRIERCKGCGLCVPVCPNDNIRMSSGINKSGHKYGEVIDEDKCTGCGLCFLMCPDVVIEIASGEGEAVKTESVKGTGGSET